MASASQPLTQGPLRVVRHAHAQQAYHQLLFAIARTNPRFDLFRHPDQGPAEEIVDLDIQCFAADMMRRSCFAVMGITLRGLCRPHLHPFLNDSAPSSMGLNEAIELGLKPAFERIDGLQMSWEEVHATYPRMVAWTTWHRIAQSVGSALKHYENPDASTLGSIKRLADQVINCVEWHEDALP